MAVSFFKNVTLLITHYNRSTSLECLLNTFRELECTFEEIVIADDHSEQKHLEKVAALQKTYDFRLVTSPANMALGHNFNKGQDAVKTPYTLYIQEDFIPNSSFNEHFKDGLAMMDERPDIDIVRFYSYIRYPHLKHYKNGFSEMILKPRSLNYLKLFYYSDHPHLRRSSFPNKFGRYKELRRSDRTEYLMCISFFQKRGKGLFYDDYKGLFYQKNREDEPSTVKRHNLTFSTNPLIAFLRSFYRQIKYNVDIIFLNTELSPPGKPQSERPIRTKPAVIDRSDRIISKIISAYIKITYPKVNPLYKPFYIYTIYYRIAQFKYIIKDFVVKKKYKILSFNGEFAPELLFVLPFAYWHYKNGTLKETISSNNSSELYFFSPDHKEIFPTRSNTGNYNFEIPRILYSHNYNMKKWEQVPLKETYRNNIYIFEKPILIIANRYNSEWDGPPISYFSLPIISFIIANLKDEYTIIYNRPRPEDITIDESDIFDLNEFEWLRIEHPEVILMEDLWKKNPGHANNYNHLQLMVYANAQHFISTHGGTGTLASYFGGTNLIFSKQGPEHHFNCFQTLFPKLSGATIIHAKTEDELKQEILAFRGYTAVNA